MATKRDVRAIQLLLTIGGKYCGARPIDHEGGQRFLTDAMSREQAWTAWWTASAVLDMCPGKPGRYGRYEQTVLEILNSAPDGARIVLVPTGHWGEYPAQLSMDVWASVPTINE